MTKRFEKAYNALYKAFMNDTLAKGECSACAVGNIIADAMGLEIKATPYLGYKCSGNNTWWGSVFGTYHQKQVIFNHKISGVKYRREKIKKLTGYSWKEMAKIEFAFEINTKYSWTGYHYLTYDEIMNDQFNGLMAVMDVMIELDEIVEGEKYKQLFKNKFSHVEV